MNVLTILVVIAFSMVWTNCANAQSMSGPKLVAKDALFYARISDAVSLRERLSETSLGLLVNDPELEPFTQTFYTSFLKGVQELQGTIGLSLDELLLVPNGELTAAVIPTSNGICCCAFVDAKDEAPAVSLMIRKLESQTDIAKSSGKVGRLEVVSLSGSFLWGQSFCYFEDAGYYVFCSDPSYARNLALVWSENGVDHRSIAENPEFSSILSRCTVVEKESPQVVFYCDPIGLLRETMRGQEFSDMILNGAVSLGLDGIKGLGGTATFATKDFDSIFHFHLLIDKARRGVLRALHPKNGSVEPESWVTDNALSYSTINLNIKETLRSVSEICDVFQGQGFVDSQFATLDTVLGIDLRKNLLDFATGRISIVQSNVLPKRLNSQSTLYGLRVSERDRIGSIILPKIFQTLKEGDHRWQSDALGNCTLYYLDTAAQQRRFSVRIPQPTFALLDETILVGDSRDVVENAIKTEQTGDGLLIDSLEYKVVRERLNQQAKGRGYSVFAYQRPEESFRLLYDILARPESIPNIESVSEGNPFYSALLSAMRNDKLPPFESISKYLAPNGAFLSDEDNGLHYVVFSLRRD